MSTIKNDNELNEAIDSGRLKKFGQVADFQYFEDQEIGDTWICI